MPLPPRSRLSAPALALAGLLSQGLPAPAQEPAAPPPAPASETRIGVIYRPQQAPASYDAEAVPEDEGVAGARMAIQDNNTTGRFTKQTYALDEVALGEGTPGAAEAAKELVDKGVKYLVLAL